MSTRIQARQRPHAKGKHQRTGQRPVKRENPPAGTPWGQKGWPAGGGGAAPGVALHWEAFGAEAFVAPAGIRANTFTDPTTVGVVHIDKDATTDPLMTPEACPVGSTLTLTSGARRLVVTTTDFPPSSNDEFAYWAITVTYVSDVDWELVAVNDPVTLAIAAGAIRTPRDAPGEFTIDQVKAYVNGLPQDDQRAGVIQGILDLERADKNRSTLVSWLDQQLGVE